MGRERGHGAELRQGGGVGMDSGQGAPQQHAGELQLHGRVQGRAVLDTGCRPVNRGGLQQLMIREADSEAPAFCHGQQGMFLPLWFTHMACYGM